MAKLKDLNSFKTGHPEIDADHEEMAAIIDAISDAVSEDMDSGVCRRLLDSFMEVASRHFEREEAILARIGFPNLDQHRMYHRTLLDQSMAVKLSCDKLMQQNKLRDCFEEMAHFFIDDVIRGDMEFVSFLQADAERRR